MNIGLVAHDGKKKLLQSFCIAYKGILSKHDLFATGTTGRMIEEASGLTVHKYIAGPLGGSNQLAAQVENNEIDMLIYLRDTNPMGNNPMGGRLGGSSITDMFGLCDSNNIPFATNIATAELLIKALDRGDLDWRELYRN